MNTKEVVEEVLIDIPKTRDDDFLLCLHVFIRLGYAHRIPDGVVIHFKNIDYAPVFETITRIRREIQNDEKRLLPNDETMVRRYRNQLRMREHYSTKSMSINTYPNSWMLS